MPVPVSSFVIPTLRLSCCSQHHASTSPLLAHGPCAGYTPTSDKLTWSASLPTFMLTQPDAHTCSPKREDQQVARKKQHTGSPRLIIRAVPLFVKMLAPSSGCGSAGRNVLHAERQQPRRG